MQTLTRRGLSAGLLTVVPTTTTAFANLANPRDAGSRGGGERLPAFDDFWSRLPLPFTPAQAFGLLDPATQTEIGAAVIGKALAEYIYGDGRAHADQFLDGKLRDDADTVAHEILNRIDDRLWSLFPDLYGPDGDHPAWALQGGFAR